MATLDVYRDWLGIKETDRPLNHYQLLRLKKFEDDPEKIREHYRKLNAHVRKYATGQYGSQSQALLNELAKAMLCLTDAQRKREYDASLGREVKGVKARTLEELLLARKVLDSEQLGKARRYADAVGVEVRDAVVQQKLAAPEKVTELYAESIGAPFIDLTETEIDEFLVPKVPALLARQNSCVPIMVDDDQLLMASPVPLRPEIEEEIRLRVGFPVRTVIATAPNLHNLVNKYYPKEAADAEMTAGVAAGKVGSKGGAKSSGAASATAAKPESDKTPEELAKERRMLMIVGFNLGFIGVMVATQVVMTYPFFRSLLMAIGAGVLGLGIMYLVGKNRR